MRSSKNIAKRKDECPGCGGLKYRWSKTCKACDGARRRGRAYGAVGPRKQGYAGFAADMIETALRDVAPLRNGHARKMTRKELRAAATALDWMARRPARLKADIAFEGAGLDLDVVRERIGYERLVKRLLQIGGVE